MSYLVVKTVKLRNAKRLKQLSIEAAEKKDTMTKKIEILIQAYLVKLTMYFKVEDRFLYESK